MLLGMSLRTFTIVHVVISLIGIIGESWQSVYGLAAATIPCGRQYFC